MDPVSKMVWGVREAVMIQGWLLKEGRVVRECGTVVLIPATGNRRFVNCHCLIVFSPTLYFNQAFNCNRARWAALRNYNYFFFLPLVFTVEF